MSLESTTVVQVQVRSKKRNRKLKATVTLDAISPQSKAIPIPKKTSEFSSNWKVLSKGIIPENPIKPRKPKQMEVMEEGGFTVVQTKAVHAVMPKEYLNTFGFLEYTHYGQLKHCTDDLIPDIFKKVGRYVAIDCEMVGVDEMKMDAVARVSIVNHHGYCLLDTFVKPKLPVTDYRTEFSGVREEDLLNAPSLEEVMKKVCDIIRGKILVGHAIHNDLDVLFIQHPRYRLRDTAWYFRKKMGRTPSLKLLAEMHLKTVIQTGEHSSIQDAQAAMKLYLLHKKVWEKSLEERRRR